MEVILGPPLAVAGSRFVLFCLVGIRQKICVLGSPSGLAVCRMVSFYRQRATFQGPLKSPFFLSFLPGLTWCVRLRHICLQNVPFAAQTYQRSSFFPKSFCVTSFFKATFASKDFGDRPMIQRVCLVKGAFARPPSLLRKPFAPPANLVCGRYLICPDGHRAVFAPGWLGRLWGAGRTSELTRCEPLRR